MDAEGADSCRDEPGQRTCSVIDDLPGIESDGLLGRVGERFPLGRGLESVDLGSEPPSGPDTRPFGLRYLTPVVADSANVLDLSETTYCPERQMSMMQGELFILAATKERTVEEYDTREDNQVFPDKQEDTLTD